MAVMLRWMYGRLPGQLGGADPQGLIERRVDRADQDVHQDPEGHRHRGQHPALLADVVEEQAGGDDGDGDEQGQGRLVGVDAGGGGAVDDVVAGQHQLEALEVVVDGLDERQDAEQHRQVGLDRGGHPPLGALEVDAAVEVVGDGGDDEHHDQRFEGPAEQELDERQLEDVEADVLVVLGVGGPEGDVVAEQIPVVPLPVGADSGQQGEDRGGDDPHRPGVRADDIAVAHHQLVGRARRRLVGGDPVGDDQVAEHHERRRCR